ncbi:MAG: CDP-alcohol phosphatidyltransferase family protein [Isosphaeraceae bacterium]
MLGQRQAPSPGEPARRPTTLERVLGWCVHAYTALGLVAAAVMAVLLVQGGATAFRWCFLLMALATIVDATDGALARKVRIKEVVPGFDGRRLDDIIDYLNYTFLPMLLIWRAGILPAGQEAWLILALLASIYGFCQVQAKTDDGYFLGFPSLWNLVAFYLYVLPLGPWASLGVVILLSLLTFVPSKYLYPSQPGAFNRLATALGVLWAFLIGWSIWILPEDGSPAEAGSLLSLTSVSLVYPAFYMGASWVITLRDWWRRKPPV